MNVTAVFSERYLETVKSYLIIVKFKELGGSVLHKDVCLCLVQQNEINESNLLYQTVQIQTRTKQRCYICKLILLWFGKISRQAVIATMDYFVKMQTVVHLAKYAVFLFS